MHVNNRGFSLVGVVRVSAHSTGWSSHLVPVNPACQPLALSPALRASGPFLTAGPTSPLQLVRL